MPAPTPREDSQAVENLRPAADIDDESFMREQQEQKQRAAAVIDSIEESMRRLDPEIRHAASAVLGAFRAANNSENAQYIDLWEGIVFDNLFYGGWHEYGTGSQRGTRYAEAWTRVVENVGGVELDAPVASWIGDRVTAYAKLAWEHAEQTNAQFGIDNLRDAPEIRRKVVREAYRARLAAYEGWYYQFLEDLHNGLPHDTYVKVFSFFELVQLPLPQGR
jgi:hypothetical protein